MYIYTDVQILKDDKKYHEKKLKGAGGGGLNLSYIN